MNEVPLVGVITDSAQEPSARARRAARRAEGQAVDSQDDLPLAFWGHNARGRQHQAEVKDSR
jgi:hypothetical protein